MVLPEAGEKFKHTCRHCKYFVTVVGHQETRRVCLAGVKAYRSGYKSVPDSIGIVELMLLLGKETLQELLGKGRLDQIACGTFEQRI